MGMSVPKATSIAYGLILLLSLVFSLGAEMVLEGMGSVTESGWGRIVRNLMIMIGIAFRYFFLTHQLRLREQAELTSRIQSLQSRIRPHFLFNSMNIIASLISIDPDLAEEVVEDLSSLFRASLSDSTSQPVTLAQELGLCEKYVHIECLRLDDRLTVQWDVNVDTGAIEIPLLTLQPLLENSIYHGIQPLPKGGTVNVSVELAGPQVQIEVTNPLPGTPYEHEQGNGIAIDNIRNRMTALYGPDAQLTTDITGGLFTARLIYPVKS
jgi:two-component system sensor histidine kinase AlgZ